jgi:hypothetical protein
MESFWRLWRASVVSRIARVKRARTLRVRHYAPGGQVAQHDPVFIRTESPGFAGVALRLASMPALLMPRARAEALSVARLPDTLF